MSWWIKKVRSKLDGIQASSTNPDIWAINLLGPTFDRFSHNIKNIIEQVFQAEVKYININPFYLFFDYYVTRSERSSYYPHESYDNGCKSDFFLPSFRNVLFKLSEDDYVGKILKKINNAQSTVPILSLIGVSFFDPRKEDILSFIPNSNHGTVLHLESIENECRVFEEADIKYPYTEMYDSLEEAKRALTSVRDKKTVVLPNLGSGGIGVRVVDNNEPVAPRFGDVEQEIYDGKVALRDHIPHKHAPNAIGLVTRSGRSTTLAITDQIIYNNYYGGNSFPSQVTADLQDMIGKANEEIGSILAQQGYFGIYGCDFIVSNNNELYCIDLNPRFQSGLPLVMRALENVDSTLFKKVVQTEIGKSIDDLPSRPALSKYDGAWAHTRLRPTDTPYKITSRITGEDPINVLDHSNDSESVPTSVRSYLPGGTTFIGGSHIGWAVSRGSDVESVLENLMESVSEASEIIYNKNHGYK